MWAHTLNVLRKHPPLWETVQFSHMTVLHNVLGYLNLYKCKHRTLPLLCSSGVLPSLSLSDWCERTDRFIECTFARCSPSGLNRAAKYSEQQGQRTEMMIVDIYRAPVKTNSQTGLGLWGWTRIRKKKKPFATQSILYRMGLNWLKWVQSCRKKCIRRLERSVKLQSVVKKKKH